MCAGYSELQCSEEWREETADAVTVSARSNNHIITLPKNILKMFDNPGCMEQIVLFVLYGFRI